MKTFWAIVLGLFLLVGCKDKGVSTLGNWVKKNAFEGGARGGAVSFVIGEKAYIGLGYNQEEETNKGYFKDFWMYNPATDKYIQVADFPGNGRKYSVGFSINGKGYVATGYDGENKLKDVWEYDPSTNKWSQKDDFAGGERYWAVGFSIKNFGYIGTGYGNSTMDKVDFYKFNPSAAAGSQWTKVQSISGDPRRGATAFTYNDKAYVCTGSSSGSKLTDMYEYDPTADSWTKKVSLTDNSDWTIIRERASSFVLDNKAYVVLGSNSSLLNTCWEYDFAQNTWLEKSNFEGSPREAAVSFAVGGKAIIATGEASNNALYDVWEFRPYEESNTND